MRNLRWQILIAAGGLVVVVLLLIGQGSFPEVDTALPVAGGSYAEGLIGSLNRMNPILDTNNQVDRDINRLIYSSLVQFDSRGNPIPDLAQVAVSADATIYTFTIRNDAMWHDGEPVTSDDVIYTFSKFQDESYPGAEDLHEFWQEVNVVQLDEKTVQFQLSEPFAPFLDYVSTGLLPDHLLRGVDIQALIDHPFNLNPVGSGAFKFDRYLLDEGSVKGVSLVANEEYYGQRPFLERLEFRFYESTEEALDAYHSEGYC